MIRHFNATGRKRIRLEDVAVSIRSAEVGEPPIFDLQPKLGSYHFPASAEVRVEAWRRYDSQRWDFGTVGSLDIPDEELRRMTRVPVTSQFKVMVIDGEGSGRLLGASANIRPRLPINSLIPLRTADLRDEVWRIQFSEDDLPEMLINGDIETMNERVRKDAQFRSLVMPEVMRSVLTHILFVERASPDDDTGGWWTGWFNLAATLHEERPPASVEPDDETSRNEAEEWIATIVANFAERKVKAASTYEAAIADER